MKMIIVLGRNSNNVFRLVWITKIEGTDVVGGRCIGRNDGILNLN